MNPRSTLLTLALLVLPGTALADAVDVSLSGRALVGQGVPTVNLQIIERIAGFELRLKRSDGKAVSIKGGGKPGQKRALPLDQPEGKFHYEGELAVNYPDGTTGSMPLQFDTELFGPLRMKLENKDFDEANRKVTFRINRPAGKAHVKVMLDSGKMFMDDDVLFNGEPAETPLEVTWPETSGKIMKISIQAYDTSTFFTGVDIFPWFIDVPHEDPVFDSGKWDIRPEERAKLEKSLTQISEQVSKFGRFAEIKLYILGATDTVGDKASNRTLSVNRARSIGAYFKKRGLKVPVLYEGYGEELLFVKTPDETDEQQNRRAIYLLSVQPPPLKNAPFEPKWQKL